MLFTTATERAREEEVEETAEERKSELVLAECKGGAGALVTEIIVSPKLLEGEVAIVNVRNGRAVVNPGDQVHLSIAAAAAAAHSQSHHQPGGICCAVKSRICFATHLNL